MKRIISIALTLVMVLGMSIAVMADDVQYAPSEGTTFEQIYKTYVSENDVQVAETLEFVSTPDSGNPDMTNLTVSDLTVGTALEDLPIEIAIPSYTKAGVYEYTITETAGNTAGVEYTDSTIYVTVMIEYDNENKKLVIADVESFIKKVNDEKTDTFENTFSSGSFTVAKQVQGNMANQNDEFEITVTLTAPTGKVIGTPIEVGGQSVAPTAWANGVYTTTLTLSHADGAVAFNDIPVGVTVAVAENTAADKMNDGYEQVSITNDGALTIANDTAANIVVLNEKNTEVDTGISMDSIPYILIVAVVFVGLVAFVSKKRATREF